jgi:hypothetical protein
MPRKDGLPIQQRRRADRFTRSKHTKDRVCLRCNKTFLSTGPGNRICDPCDDLNVKQTIHRVNFNSFKKPLD